MNFPAPAATANDILVALASLLRSRGWTLATAESCTGGQIAAACTELAGSSDWFERGFVTYSNAAKTELLGVERQFSVSPPRSGLMSASPKGSGLGQTQGSRCRVTVPVLRGRP
jgi:nicotinamide-nucleotide amidase